jgi:hypothetical protein
VSGATVIFAGLAILLGPFGQPIAIVPLGAEVVTPSDFGIGLQSMVLDVLVIATLAHFGLARWKAWQLPFPIKLLAGLSVTVAAHLWLASLVL